VRGGPEVAAGRVKVSSMTPLHPAVQRIRRRSPGMEYEECIIGSRVTVYF